MSPRKHVRRLRVDADDRVVIDGRDLRLHAMTEQGYVFDVVGSPGCQLEFSFAQFECEADRAGFRQDRRFYAAGQAAARLAAGVPRLSGVPKREISGLLFRLEWVEHFLALEEAGEVTRSDAGVAVATGRIHAELEAQRLGRNAEGGRKGQVNSRPKASDHPVRKPCGKTLLRYVTRFERGGRSPLALRSGHHRSGNRTVRLEPEALRLLIEAAKGYMSIERPKKAACYRFMRAAARELNLKRVAEGLPEIRCPAKQRLYEEIDALPVFQVHAARRTPAEAMAIYGPLGAGLDVKRAGQRVEFDEWLVHAQSLLEEHEVWPRLDASWRETAKRHRLWVCEALDAASRLTFALSFASTGGTTENAMSCLAMVFADKSPLAAWAGAKSRWDMRCSPEEIVTDGGGGFVSEEFEAAVLDLLGDKATTPAGVPQLRGRSERNFLTKEMKLMPLLPGRTFNNAVERGDYPAEERAVILDTVLRKLIIIHVVDEQHNSPHGGLKGATPLDTWDDLVATYGIYKEPDAEDRRNALGAKLTRTVGRHGVHVLGLHYTSEELERRFRDEGPRAATVSVDPADLGHVSVWSNDGWLPCVCTQRGLSGVPLEVWVAAEADLRRRHAARARLSEGVVLDAILKMKAIVGQAVDQFGLGGACPSPAEFDRLEAQVQIAFHPRGDVEDPPARDLKAEAVPRGTPVEDYAVMAEDPNDPDDLEPESDEPYHAFRDADGDDAGAPEARTEADPTASGVGGIAPQEPSEQDDDNEPYHAFRDDDDE